MAAGGSRVKEGNVLCSDNGLTRWSREAGAETIGPS